MLFIVIGFVFSITGSHYDADGQYHEHSFWPRVIEEKYDGFSTCLLMKADNLNKDNYVNVRKLYIYFALRKENFKYFYEMKLYVMREQGGGEGMALVNHDFTLVTYHTFSFSAFYYNLIFPKEKKCIVVIESQYFQIQRYDQ